MLLAPDHHPGSFLFLLISHSLYYIPAIHYSTFLSLGFCFSTLMSLYLSSFCAHAFFFFAIFQTSHSFNLSVVVVHLCVIVLPHVYIPISVHSVLTSLCSSIHLPPTFCMNTVPILHFVSLPPFLRPHITSHKD
jgi:hypothetical protein